MLYDGADRPKIGRTTETADPLEETTGGATLREVGPAGASVAGDHTEEELAGNSEVCDKPYRSGVPCCSTGACASISRATASIAPRCCDLKCAQYPDFFLGQQRP